MESKLNLGEFRVLRALERGASYGLEIQKFVAETIVTNRPVSLGGIYTLLHSLEEKRLITGKWGSDQEARLGARRRHYTLTPLGTRRLREAKEEFRRMLDGASEPPRVIEAAKARAGGARQK
jgi:PadR family transcriptional regulator PadR